MNPNLSIILVSFVALAAFPSSSRALEKPSSAAELFEYSKVWDVEIRISEEGYKALTPEGGRGFDRDFPYATAEVLIAGHDPLKVGLRYKGNSSYSSAGDTKKKSFKIDFNRVLENQDFLGLSKLNLNNNILDPSQARETLAYLMFNDMGLASCRTAFARVYLQAGKGKREYLGLYTMVEQVNGAFLKERFGTSKGLLLKPERNNSFPYLGQSWQEYESSYVPKTSAAPEFSRRLMEFTRFVEESSDEEFARKISGYIDLPGFLRFTALHAVLSHLDSFLLRGHNFYIYLPRSSGKFHWIPWDVNSTFAGHRSAGSASQQINLSISQPYADGVRLLSRILKIKSIRARYLKEIEAVLAGPFKAETLQARMQAILKAIGPAVAKDHNTDPARFKANFTKSPSNKAGQSLEQPRDRSGFRSGLQQKPMLVDFIAGRTSSILSQLRDGQEGYVPRLNSRRSRGDRGRRPEGNSRRPSRGPFPRRPGREN